MNPRPRPPVTLPADRFQGGRSADPDSQNFHILAFGVGRAACQAAKEDAKAREDPPAPSGTWFAYDPDVEGCVPLDNFGLRTPEDLAVWLRRETGNPFRVQRGHVEGHVLVSDNTTDVPGQEVYTVAQDRWKCVAYRREIRRQVRHATVVDLTSR
jgi:hypothetical protein